MYYTPGTLGLFIALMVGAFRIFFGCIALACKLIWRILVWAFSAIAWCVGRVQAWADRPETERVGEGEDCEPIPL